MSQFQPISDDLFNELLGGEKPIVYNSPKQHGPFNRVDKPGRCTSRWCGVETNFKILGAYKCSIHALEQLNEMICGRPRLDPSPPISDLLDHTEPWLTEDGTDDGNDFKEPI